MPITVEVIVLCDGGGWVRWNADVCVVQHCCIVSVDGDCVSGCTDRALWTRQAFEDLWLPDPSVVAVTPFLLVRAGRVAVRVLLTNHVTHIIGCATLTCQPLGMV